MPRHMIAEIDASQIPEFDENEQLTDEEKTARLNAATAAMFATIFGAPKVAGGKAKEILDARQDKAVGAALAALAAAQ